MSRLENDVYDAIYDDSNGIVANCCDANDANDEQTHCAQACNAFTEMKKDTQQVLRCMRQFQSSRLTNCFTIDSHPRLSETLHSLSNALS